VHTYASLIVVGKHDQPIVYASSVTTLVLGLRPRQGIARLRAKRRSLGVRISVDSRMFREKLQGSNPMD